MDLYINVKTYKNEDLVSELDIQGRYEFLNWLRKLQKNAEITGDIETLKYIKVHNFEDHLEKGEQVFTTILDDLENGIEYHIKVDCLNVIKFIAND